MRLLFTRIFSFFTLLLFSYCAFAQTFEGQLETTAFDYFDQNKSTTLYQLHVGDQLYTLDLPKSMDKSQLLTGNSATIEGQYLQGLQEKTIKVDSLRVTDAETIRSEGIDSRKVIALIVNFNNKKTSDMLKITDIDRILYTDAKSMQVNYSMTSDNQVQFVRDTNNDGAPDIFIVNLNYDLGTTCDNNKWSNDANVVAAQSGIDLKAYRHHMFILPNTIACSWGGLANIGCKTSCTSWIRAYAPNNPYNMSTTTHEIGHNFGMNHASTDPGNDGTPDGEYGDGSTYMGNGLLEGNAPHRDMMHWFDANPNQITRVLSSGQFLLDSLEQTVKDTTTLKVLKFKKDDGSTYYVSYRKNLGVFGMVAAYRDRVSIHRVDGKDAHTYFITSLGAGQSFNDALNGISVFVNAVGGNTASVNVTLPAAL